MGEERELESLKLIRAFVMLPILKFFHPLAHSFIRPLRSASVPGSGHPSMVVRTKPGPLASCLKSFVQVRPWENT